ncbi:MAG: 4Fe-4S dicluster domain-containing protein [Rhodospirillaceae bacterium]|nr:4Fe-4S dicluster domain-containing protein [Rhodospirillaceae bacterium]
MAKTLILCDCLGSQELDRDKIEAAAGVACSRIHSSLCTAEAGDAAEAISRGFAIIACQQEKARFEEIAEDVGTPPPGFVDLRDRAGWSDEASEAGPKQAALVAEALLPTPRTRAVDVTSEGRCLVLGRSAVALPAADRLSGPLAVTALVSDEPEDFPLDRRFEVIAGRLKTASGALGGFHLHIDALRQIEPGGRGGFALSAPRDGAETECDVVLDLSGNPPLFPAPGKREGYLRADPGDPNAVAAAVFEAGQMVGTFEKLLYVRLEESLCAHSRAGKTGCTKCLDACPTGAIAPDGDHVAIDAMICAGCGTCSALCPSSAITYDAPPTAALFKRIETLATVYRKAGGAAPRLLVTDNGFGAEMIALSARLGRGLPADVIPLELETLSQFGHAEMLAALGTGFAAVDILLSPRSERDLLDRELGLAAAMGGGARLRLLDVADPDALSEVLYDTPADPQTADPVLPLGSRRQVARLAAKALNPGSDDVLPLPDGAPYGAVRIDVKACTLCLACVSLCPPGALADNPDRPQLRFQEDACLQCGLCKRVCPESAVTLEPRLDLSDAALAHEILNEEEPYECVECGKPFGVKSTVERIVAELAGKHSMFASEDASRMIRMCDDCRIASQYHSENNPFASGERPRIRTSDDYFSDRKDH